MPDYATLQSDIAGFSSKQSTTAQIPTFIRLAEAYIGRDVRVIEMEIDANLVIPDTGLLKLPTGFLGFRAVALDNAGSLSIDPTLNYMTPDQFNELKLGRQTFSGLVRDNYYTLTAANIKIQPVPGPGLTTTLVTTYTGRFAELTDTNTTNWLLDNHYDIYLYASLLHAWVFSMDEAELLKYERLYTKGVEGLTVSENRKRRAGPHIRRPREAP